MSSPPSPAPPSALFERIFDELPSPALVRSLETSTFVAVNRAFEDAFGYPRADVIGRGPSELQLLVPAIDDERNMARLASAGKLVDEPATIRRADGGFVDVVFSARTVTVEGRDYLVVVLYGLGVR